MLKRARRLALVAVASLQLSCPGMGQMLRLYGYTEVRPPSKLFAPGTMVWIKSNRPFSAGVICTQEMSMGRKFRPLTSPTASADLSQATQKEFALDGDYLDVLRADARFNDIASVRVKLDNPVLFELTDVDVVRFLAQRSPLCRHAIAQRHNAGYKVTMIASALRADVTYTVSWKRTTRLDGGSKRGALKDLATELGAEQSNVTEHTIAAKDLYWGIKDDVFLANLSDPGYVGEPQEHTRGMAPAYVPVLSRAPDVRARGEGSTAERDPYFAAPEEDDPYGE